MSFDNILLPYLAFETIIEEDGSETLNRTYAYFPIETFKISKYLIAHFADITLYDLFIINAYGYAQHKYLKNGKFSETSDISRNKIIIKTFKMFYIDNEKNDTNSTDYISTENLLETTIGNLAEPTTVIETEPTTGFLNSTDYTDNYNDDDREIKEIIIFNKCMSPEDVINPNETMKRVSCKEDYLPYLDQKCLDEEFVSFKTSSLLLITVKFV